MKDRKLHILTVLKFWHMYSAVRPSPQSRQLNTCSGHLVLFLVPLAFPPSFLNPAIPIPGPPPIYFLSLYTSLWFLGFYIQYLLFCTIILRLTHAVVYTHGSGLFIAGLGVPLCEWHLIIHFPVYEHSDCFWFRAIANKAALNTCLLWTYIFISSR